MIPPRGEVFAFLAADHARLDALIERAVAAPDVVDRGAWDAFRAGLLRHIAMEEKVLLPEARRLHGGERLPLARRLRADHAALGALLVAPPTHAIAMTVRAILEAHNLLEEGPGGAYEACEALAGGRLLELHARLVAVPEVPVAPYRDTPNVHAHIARVMRERAAQGR